MKIRSKDEWEKLFKAFGESGLSQRAFCDQHNINLHSFSWQKQHHFKDSSLTAVSAEFIPVTFPVTHKKPDRTGGVELRIGEVASLYISRDTDPQLVRTIIEAAFACGRI